MRIFLTVILICIWSSIYAQNEAATSCIDCHSDNTLTMERNGKEISLFVNADSYKNSVHGSMECTDCHTGFDAESIPHKEGTNISRVDCAQCHDTDTFSKSIHAVKNVRCYSCHTKHDIQPAESLAKNEINFCLTCHKSSTSVNAYTKSIHHQRFIKGGQGPSCVDCHNGSAHAVKAADFTKKEEQALCATCHKSVNMEFAKSVHALAMDEKSPGCVSCHGSHETFNNKYSISSQACIKCHLDESKFTEKGMVDFVRNYQTSVHARVSEKGHEAAACVDCHDNHMIVGIEVTQSKIARDNIPVTCGKCHQNVLNDYKKSTHATAFFSGSNLAPNCTDCHGEHSIQTVTRSALNKVEIHKMCFSCHVNNPEVVKKIKINPQEILNYEQSVHFQMLKNGNNSAPTCSDCHGGHTLQAADVNTSRIRRENIQNTCGSQGCHPNEAVEFNSSIHAEAVKMGIKDAPTCITCHGNHQVFGTHNPQSKVGTRQNVVVLCSSCHSDVELNEKYGLPVGKTESYLESYHGLAVRGGSKFAADCASCHGAHGIKPSNDPASRIHRNNLSVTCGKCHPGANITANFRQVHLTGVKEESAILYWITYIYVILIVVIIGLMLVHNLLDYIRKRKEKKAHKEEIEELKKSGKVYLRMTFGERIQHFIMLTSFIILVFTGFGLKYPESWWVQIIRWIFGEAAFDARSITHRVFGIAMIAISLYHLYYLMFTRRGRQLFLDFLPVKKDLTDFIINIRYLLGISKEKPFFGRFSYMEKAEYWALVWGVIIMSGTGIVLMFNTYFLSIAPKIMLDAATLIHLFEAWLATLAIIVWHFYFVIFNPEVYPLNQAFIKGTMSEEEMKHEHPLELEKIKEKEIKKIDKG